MKSLSSLMAMGAFIASLSATVAAAPPAKPGGSGQLTLGGVAPVCFKSVSKQVPIVCGTITVHYKLDTLMGDPLGHYGLVWKLSSFHIANADGKGSQNYLGGSVPNVLWDAAQTTELSIYAAALVRGSTPPAALQFNTGVAVRPGGQVSFNVPDGYNWDQFLIRAKPGSGPDWICSENSVNWVQPDDAKNLMRGSIDLYNLKVCPRSSVSVERLESAIAAYCEAHPKSGARYCPKEDQSPAHDDKNQPPADPFASLGGSTPSKAGANKPAGNDPFASLESEKRFGGPPPSQDMAGAFEKAEAAAERKRRYDAAYASCELDLTAQQSCAKDSCGREPVKEACIRTEWYDACAGRKGLCLGQMQQCVEHGPNPKYAQWQNCQRDAEAQCANVSKKITSVSACAAERVKP